MEGRLWGDLRISGLHVAMPGIAVDAERFDLEWQPLAIFRGRVSVSELAIDGLRIRDDRPETPGPPGFTWPRMSSAIPPLPIWFRSLQLRNARYDRPGQQPVRIDSFQGDLLFSLGTILVRDLSLRMPGFQASGSLLAGFQRPALRADLQVIAWKPVSGVDRIEITTDLAGTEAPAQLDGSIETTLFSGTARIVRLQAGLAVTNSSLRLRSAVLSRPGRRGRVTGQAELVFGAESPVFQGDLALAGIDLSREVPFLNDLNGSISISGNQQEYEGSFVLEQKDRGWKAGRLEAGFRGTTSSLALTAINGNWFEGTLRGSARMNWKKLLTISASLRARNMNPAHIAPAWPGTINMDLDGTVRLPQNRQPRGRLSLRLLKSRIRGEALRGDAAARLDQGTIALDRMVFEGTGFHGKAEGDLARGFDFSVGLSDLSLLKPGAAGRARMEGRVRKKEGAYSGSVTLQGRRLAMNGVKAGSLDLRARIEDREGFPFSLKLSLQNGAYDLVRFDSLALDAAGSLRDHRVSAALRSSIYEIAASLAGSWQEKTWQGTILRFSGSDPEGVWKTTEPASLIISRTRFSLSPVVLTGKGGELVRLQGSGETGPLSGSFALDWRELNIARLNEWLTGLTVHGFTSGRITGKVLPDGLLEVSGNVDLSKGGISRTIRGLEVKAELRKADLALHWRGEVLEGKLSLVFAEQGRIDANLQAPLPARLPIALNRDGPLRGALSGRVREMGLLSLLFPGLVQETRGQLDLDLRIGGTWSAPSPRGTLRLGNAAAYFPAAGIHVTDILLDAGMEGSTIRIASFKARSGKGSLQGKGAVFLEGWLPARYEGSLEGERFQAMFLPQMRLQVSPKIEFEGTPKKLTAKGEVRVPELLVYGPPAEGPIEPSEDVVIVGGQKEETAARMAMEIDIRVILGDRVIVKAEGVDASLGGEVLLTIRSLQEMTGKGEIKVIKGRYGIYGVSLDITRGRLFFAGGAIGNPTLDILALKTVNEVKAGVLVSGTLQRPVVKLYSEPALPETDILAYIVLGHPLGQDQEQGALLMRAAAALLSAGQSVALQDQIKNRLGLDTIDIESGKGEVSRSLVTIGKYLSRRLYISYGYALFTGESLFRLRYRFGRNWELESRSGATSGVDLYYTIQFD